MTTGKQQDKPIRIAMDAMGGDYAPVEVVKGAIEAAKLDAIEVILVGERDEVEEQLGQSGGRDLPISIVGSEGKIGEDEHPVHALRQKPAASIAVAAKLVKEGKADALVSMGSTGATLASASLILGIIDGLERPCIGGPFLGLAPKTVLVDMGSNVDCRSPLLLSFAAMGCVFARQFLDIQNPRVGLLSIGAEEAKGNRQVKEGYQLFKESNLNFVGNVEGMDFFTGKADVIVCDGFVGNIIMKFTEGLGATMAAYLKKALDGKVSTSDLEPLASKIWEVNNLPRKMGGPLFGVNGVTIVGHGASMAEGVAGAINTATRAVKLNLVDGIRTELAALQNGLPQAERP